MKFGLSQIYMPDFWYLPSTLESKVKLESVYGPMDFRPALAFAIPSLNIWQKSSQLVFIHRCTRAFVPMCQCLGCA